MPEFQLHDDLGKLKAAALSEDEGMAYQSIGAVGVMTMSYMVTVLHFCLVGEPRVDVIDSRSGRDTLACIKKELERSGREIQFRLVITEDLPRDTYDLLRNVIGLDARLLDDHRRNGHDSGFVGQADFDVDKAPRSMSTSIAMPFDLQIGPEIFPTATGWRGNESVEEEVKGLLKYHQLVNYLRYDWQPLFVDHPLPALFFNTYRRLSFQNIPGPLPTIAILLYPPLWDLKAFQGTKYIFHVPADLRFPPNAQRGAESRPWSPAGSRLLSANQAVCSTRIQQLIGHFMNDIDAHSLSHDALARSIMGWITINVYKSFEASIESSVRSWYNVNSYVEGRSAVHVEKKRLCERFRQLTLIKQHQMEKAKFELGIHTKSKNESRMTAHSDFTHEEYISQQWQRSQSSLQWVLDDVENALRSNEGDLQMNLTSLQIEEARKAMQQGAVVKRLTALAFVFIPISTVCSAFGMNVREFGPGMPSVWVFGVVALTISGLTVLCSLELSGNILWAVLSLLNSWAVSWRAWWQDVYDDARTEEASFSLGVATIGAKLAVVKGVEPWVDPKRKKTLKTRDLRRLPQHALAFLALAPFWVMGAMILHVQQFEQRGRAFKTGRPP
ncbi:MAG: hypothetical protein L6R36_007612 [Xanthoria steineri]|nr:MAG: hypothetical protein L6R36_007612 [Xanthoria steineri]